MNAYRNPRDADRNPRGERGSQVKGSRGKIVALGVALCLTAIATCVLPPSALGFPYAFRTTFGAPGTGNGQLELANHSGVAVNTATHDLYVADTANHRVVVFDSNGAFLRAFGADVGGPGVDVCTTGCVAGTSESAPGGFITPTFVAVDNNPLSASFGDVYVADNGDSVAHGDNRVSKFEADGTLITSWGAGGQLDGSTAEHGPFDEFEDQHVVSEVPIEIAGIAVDSTGALFVQQTGPPKVVGGPAGYMFEFSEAGSFLDDFQTPFNAAPNGIAVDSAGALYKVRGTELVVKMSPTGALIKADIGCEACAKAIAVDPTNDDLYIAREDKVERYNSTSALQETFGSSPQITRATGIAVDVALETAYVADLGGGSDRIDVFGPPPPAAPSVESTTVANISSSSANLQARINPNQRETHYRFEYVIEAQFEASGFTGATQTPERDLGAGKLPLGVIEHIGGLAPDTAYRFRVVAENELGEGVTAEPAPRFSTYAVPPLGLPDDRAYEMVSPSLKVGEVLPPEPTTQLGGSCGDCLPGENSPVMPMQSAPDGESVLYLGQPFSGGLAAGPNEYLAGRESGGWGTQALSSPVTTGPYVAFSPDLSRGVLSQIQPPLSPEAPTRGGKAFGNLYLRQEGVVQPLVTEEPPNRNPREPGEFRIRFATANPGSALEPAFGHLLFEANDALTEEVPGIAPAAPEVEAGTGKACTQPGVKCNLYEWHEGELALVNVLPGNADAASGAAIGAGRLLAGSQSPNVDHAISDDGSRVFWSAGESGEVYVRVDGEETLEIPIPGPGTCKESALPEDRVCFLTASADGTAVLLSDGQVYELNEAGNAYEPTIDLTEGEGGFEGILGAAEDLSRVYFVDTEALTEESEANENEEHAEEGKLNLYGWEEGALTFIGMLVSDDNGFAVSARFGAWMPSPSHRTAQVASDGGWLAFMSLAPLTGYDNDLRGGGNCRNSQASACREVFVYSADAGSLSCASCNPTGLRPLGYSNLSLIVPNRTEDSPPFPQPDNLSRDGSGRLFFESQDTLSPRDTNGHIQDVYEWEPQGVGSCKRADGCVNLISSGHSVVDSVFLDSSDDGEDAFFITREQLALADHDELLDLYDARVGGGIPAETESPVECQGEACQPAAVAPSDPTPASSAFAGSGNVEQAPSRRRCAKGRRQVRRKGKLRCVSRDRYRARAAHRNSGGVK
jgi:DNA-binding beta-propeller fold protein YncE